MWGQNMKLYVFLVVLLMFHHTIKIKSENPGSKFSKMSTPVSMDTKNKVHF